MFIRNILHRGIPTAYSEECLSMKGKDQLHTMTMDMEGLMECLGREGMHEVSNNVCGQE